MENNAIVHSLFSKPIFQSKRIPVLLKNEIEFLNSLTLTNNIGNKSSENKNVLSNLNMANLHEFLLLELNNFFNLIFDPQSDDLQLYITQSWVNSSDVNEFHYKHFHPNSFISGVFYIDADKNVDEIVFFEDKNFFEIPPKKFNIWNSSSWKFSVESGDLFLFPSNLIHEVKCVKNSSERKKRISLSFNTFIKGTLGDKHTSTELIL